MELPTYFMESVVKTRDASEDFEGPLALLLHLLAKDKVEIADIQIGNICDQYIAYLDRMAEMDLEIASEFVQMASHLLYLKARALITAEREISELEQLIASLEELQCKTQYIQLKGVTDELAARFLQHGGYVAKQPEYIAENEAYPYSHDLTDLLTAFNDVMRRGGEDEMIQAPFIPIPSRILYSVTGKAETLIALLKRSGETSVYRLFREAKNRSELVATVIALLELCKHGSIHFIGSGAEMKVDFTGKEIGTMDDMEIYDHELA